MKKQTSNIKAKLSSDGRYNKNIIRTYIYIYMCVYIYVCIYMCIYLCIYIHNSSLIVGRFLSLSLVEVMAQEGREKERQHHIRQVTGTWLHSSPAPCFCFSRVPWLLPRPKRSAVASWDPECALGNTTDNDRGTRGAEQDAENRCHPVSSVWSGTEVTHQTLLQCTCTISLNIRKQ